MRGKLFIILLLLSTSLWGQRKMEKLDRGLVAVKVSNGNYLSWRMTGDEWYNVTYNLYRDNVKLNSEPLEVSNYSDKNGTLTSSYTVSAIVNGIEQTPCPIAKPLSQQYLEIPMVARPAGYEINDATAADLDGDGEYEIIVKRLNNNYAADATNFTYFEAYKMDGTLMWDLNVGPNIMSSAGVEINIAAFDLDEDGKAEVFLRTSEGTIFGDGTKIGDVDKDGKTNYRYSVVQSANMQYMNEGPEFLSLVDGETGIELDRVNFIPRGNSNDWGDGYGHRANKFFFGAPYLDGKHPSLFTGRGIYTKTEMRTYDVVDKKLVSRWQFSTLNNPTYHGQGNHNYTIADVDMDGRDEIVWGSMTVDDDGKGLYSTQLGHGDALHVGDLDPFRKGTEIWKCLEESPAFGTVLYDGATGEILIHDVLGRDCGRSCAANISDDVKGASLWGSTKVFSASTKKAVNVGTEAVNFRIYWDGDLLEEVLDHNWSGGGGEGSIRKANVGEIFRAKGTNSCNWTKGTPTLQADLFGDWREEVIWRTADDSKIRIYTTINPTPYRNYTLMHDHQYRQAICWQMCGYNQPPHVSYFLGKGEGIVIPPPPTITNGRLVYNGTGTWDKTSSVWIKGSNKTVYADGEHVHFDVLNGNDVTVTLAETVAPSNLTVNSPSNYTLDATSGKLTGDMKLIKQGVGTFSLNGTHDFSGTTEIWTGRLTLNGTLTNSPVLVNFFGELAANGNLNNGVEMRYGTSLFVGGSNELGNLEINGDLSVEEDAEIVFDIHSASDTQNDSLKINGDINLANGTSFKIVPHLVDGEKRLAGGTYLLAVVSGAINLDINTIEINGILGTPAALEVRNDSIVMVIKDMRDAGAVIWNGSISKNWELATTTNFLNNGNEDLFVSGDIVLMNDDAVKTDVSILGDVSPKSITVDNSINYSFMGTGSISGKASLTKKGTGKLSIWNKNNLTGKILIENGTVEVTTMPNDISGNGALGTVSSNASLFEINGGTLSILNSTTSNKALFIGANGATIKTRSNVAWDSKISGGSLTKTGNGEMVFSTPNNQSELVISKGTVRLLNEEAQPGRSVTFEGGTLRCYDNSYTYSQATYSLKVEEGQTGTIYLDGRCEYRNTLTGKGTLNINFPWIRNDISGNWSAFEGTINLLGTSWVRYYSTAGFGKAKLNLPAGTSLTAMSGQTVHIGTLVGSGDIESASTWYIGARNDDFSFAGNIKSGAIIKVGTGTMTLTGANTTTGTTTVSTGTLIANNTSGSATGTGIVTINDGAFLGGAGTISSTVSIRLGGTIYAGDPNTMGKSLKVTNARMSSGGIYHVKINATNASCDKISTTNTFTANGELVLENTTASNYVAGQNYKIVSAALISGTFESISPATPGAGLAWDLSDFNASGIVKVVLSTGLDNRNVENLKLSPNPTTGYVYINMPESNGDATVQIESISGNVLKHEVHTNESQIRLDLSNLKSGIYIIRVYFNDRMLIEKLILE